MDTIFALATPLGRSGVAVIRVSGPDALLSAEALIGAQKLKAELSAEKASKNRPVFFLSTLHNTKSHNSKSRVSRETGKAHNQEENTVKEIIDHALVGIFKAPHSYTGEDIAEYQIHGSPVVIKALLECLSQIPKHRLAEPGEFTRRAFENGKLDLTQAEAVADLIHAETHAQHLQALSQMQGNLSTIYNNWVDKLSRTLAYTEGEIEFPDEDLPDDILDVVTPDINALLEQMTEHIDDNRRGERLRDGLRVVIIGAPNAGKSSLINSIARRDVAIVSDLEGTTRDILDVYLDLGGYPVIVSDTAGLKPEILHKEKQRNSEDAQNKEKGSLEKNSYKTQKSDHDSIEAQGIQRALDLAQSADIKILLFDGSKDLDEETLSLQDESSILVVNKLDLLKQTQKERIFKQASKIRKNSANENSNVDEKSIFWISAKQQEDIDNLLCTIEKKVIELVGERESPSLTRKRHRQALEDCIQSLIRAKTAELPELIAEDLRIAIRYLGRITGKIDVEDLLDIIFRDFCIGK